MQTRLLRLLAVLALFCVLNCVDSYSEEAENKDDAQDAQRWVGAEIDEKAAFNSARYVYEGSILKVQEDVPYQRGYTLTVEVNENFKRITEGTNTLGVRPTRERHSRVIPEVKDKVIVFTGEKGEVINQFTVFKLLPGTEETRKRMRLLAKEKGPIKEQWYGEEQSVSESYEKAALVLEVSVDYCVENIDRWRGSPWPYMLSAKKIEESFKNGSEEEKMVAEGRSFGMRVTGDYRTVIIPRRNQKVIIFTDPKYHTDIFKMMEATDEARTILRTLRDQRTKE